MGSHYHIGVRLKDDGGNITETNPSFNNAIGSLFRGVSRSEPGNFNRKGIPSVRNLIPFYDYENSVEILEGYKEYIEPVYSEPVEVIKMLDAYFPYVIENMKQYHDYEDDYEKNIEFRFWLAMYGGLVEINTAAQLAIIQKQKIALMMSLF